MAKLKSKCPECGATFSDGIALCAHRGNCTNRPESDGCVNVIKYQDHTIVYLEDAVAWVVTADGYITQYIPKGVKTTTSMALALRDLALDFLCVVDAITGRRFRIHESFPPEEKPRKPKHAKAAPTKQPKTK